MYGLLLLYSVLQANCRLKMSISGSDLIRSDQVWSGTAFRENGVLRDFGISTELSIKVVRLCSELIKSCQIRQN